MTTVTVQQQVKQRVTVTQPIGVTVSVRPTGPRGLQGIQGPPGPTLTFEAEEKITGVHVGILNQLSLTDDYLYICVHAGIAESTAGAKDGTAIWKKTILFKT